MAAMAGAAAGMPLRHSAVLVRLFAYKRPELGDGAVVRIARPADGLAPKPGRMPGGATSRRSMAKRSRMSAARRSMPTAAYPPKVLQGFVLARRISSQNSPVSSQKSAMLRRLFAWRSS